MSKRRSALAVLVAFATLAAPAVAHEGNPNFESIVTAVDGVSDLRAEVLNGDDRLSLIYTGSDTVTIRGYEREPYARLLGDGRVQVNRRSPATYLNDDRFGQVDVPDAADPKAAPQWDTVARNGRFEFHDHRIHWMSKSIPPKVKDRSKRQKVMDWSVPVEAGSSRGALRGTLWWQGDGGGVSALAYGALGVAVLVAIASVLVIRRRRGEGEDGAGAPEAW
jgi:hypothetical protein